MKYPKYLSQGAVLAVVLAAFPAAGFAQTATTDGFVCPVFNVDSAAGEKNKNAVNIAGGDTAIVTANVSVPLRATNGDGAGSPGGAHSSTGDTDYTAIWSGN